MKKSMKNQLIGLVAFLIFGAGTFAGLYFLVGNQQASAVETAALTARVMTDGGLADAGQRLPCKVLLRRDSRHRVGNAILVYRGLTADRRARIDVIIPALDPAVAYPFRIPTKKGKKGFSMARQQYRMLSVGKNQLKILFEG